MLSRGEERWLGKFVLDWSFAVYGGVAALVGASLWNSWPIPPAAAAPPAPAGRLYQIGGITGSSPANAPLSSPMHLTEYEQTCWNR
jgi:hypothetical protein